MQNITEGEFYICRVTEFHVKNKDYYGTAFVITEMYHKLKYNKIYIQEKVVPAYMMTYIKPAYLIIKAEFIGNKFVATKVLNIYANREITKNLYLSLQASKKYDLSYLLLALDYHLLEDVVEYESKDVKDALLTAPKVFANITKEDIIQNASVCLNFSSRRKPGDDDIMYVSLSLSLGKYSSSFHEYLFNKLRKLFSVSDKSYLLQSNIYSDRGYTTYRNLIENYKATPLYEEHLKLAEVKQQEVMNVLNDDYSSEDHLESYINYCLQQIRNKRTDIFSKIHRAIEVHFNHLDIPSIYKYYEN